jgi:hypothetical protein
MADEPNELREFMREMILRLDRITDRHIRRLDALTDEILDHRDETRAQTQAILKLLDRMSRFDEGSGEAPA